MTRRSRPSEEGRARRLTRGLAGLLVLLAHFARAGADTPVPRALERLEARGRWVTFSDGRAPPIDGFHRGFQTSGLVLHDGELLSVGDQRSNYPAHLLRIDVATGRVIGLPVRIEPPDASCPDPGGDFTEYRRIANSDFEGLASYPGDARRLLAVTEDKVPWLAVIALLDPASDPASGGAEDADDADDAASSSAKFRARLERLLPVRFPGDLEPWRGDTNFRLEGCTTDERRGAVLVCFERARDQLPRLCRIDLRRALARNEVELEVEPLPFASLPRRADKPEARLNINGLQFVRWKERELLVAIARDQERLLVIDLARREFENVIDLDLRAPDGGAVHWVSPEGVTLDAPRGRLFLVNDPDSVRGNYKALGDEVASGPFAVYSPLLFELDLARVLP